MKKLVVFAFLGALFLSREVNAQLPVWESLSYPYNGDITYVAHDHHARLYALTLKGLCISSDDARTWKRTNQPFPSKMIVGIDFDSVDNIYLTYQTGANYVSQDHGYSWDSIPMMPASIARLTVQHFGTQTTSYVKVNHIDTSGTWADVLSIRQLFGSNVWGYETSFDTDRVGDLMVGTNINGVFMTRDSGKHWKQIHTGELCAVAYDGPDLLYCTSNSWLYRSTDHGLTWDSTEMHGQSRANQLFVANDHTLYWAGDHPGGIFASKDHGGTWTEVLATGSPAYQIAQTNSSAFIATGGKGFSGGSAQDYVCLYRSEDTKSWNFVNGGLSSGAIVDVVTTSRGKLYVATTGTEIDSPDKAGANPYGFLIATIPATANVKTDFNGNVFIDTRFYGESLVYSPDSIRLPAFSNFSLSTLPKDTFIAMGYYGMILDSGGKWIERGTFSPQSQGTQFFRTDGDGRIYYNTNSSRSYTSTMFRSSDGGYNWDSLSVPSRICLMLEVAPNNDLYGVFEPPDLGFKLYRSRDHGDSWSSIKLPANYDSYSLGTRSICLSKYGAIYARFGSEAGQPSVLLVTWDEGASWKPVTDSNSMYVTSFAIDSSDYLYVGTDSFGLFRTPLPTSGIAMIEDASVSHLSIAPNPTRGSSMIRWLLKKDGPISIDIFDDYGRCVQSSRVAWHPAGVIELQLDASELPTGVYFCELHTKQDVVREKFVVER